jgi:4-amino-4-deoxy-L-arabinose transferase-like glycosyltransferase
MPRRLFNFLTIVSLLLCVAACVFWARSYTSSDRVRWQNERGWRSVRSASGHVELSFLDIDWSAHRLAFHGPRFKREDPRQPFAFDVEVLPYQGDTGENWERDRFAWHEKRNAERGLVHVVAVAPFWPFVVLTGFLPAVWAVALLPGHLRERRRKRAGLCPSCGYDLRATPGRCPECGGLVDKGGS